MSDDNVIGFPHGMNGDGYSKTAEAMGNPPQEVDPNGKDPHSNGAKLDSGKAQVYRYVVRYFPDALHEVSRVSEFGASKYIEGGWRTVPEGVTRYTEAMMRHLVAEARGEALDPDSELAHAAHTAWNALARLQLIIDQYRDA